MSIIIYKCVLLFCFRGHSMSPEGGFDTGPTFRRLRRVVCGAVRRGITQSRVADGAVDAAAAAGRVEGVSIYLVSTVRIHQKLELITFSRLLVSYMPLASRAYRFLGQCSSPGPSLHVRCKEIIHYIPTLVALYAFTPVMTRVSRTIYTCSAAAGLAQLPYARQIRERGHR